MREAFGEAPSEIASPNERASERSIGRSIGSRPREKKIPEPAFSFRVERIVRVVEFDQAHLRCVGRLDGKQKSRPIRDGFRQGWIPGIGNQGIWTRRIVLWSRVPKGWLYTNTMRLPADARLRDWISSRTRVMASSMELVRGRRTGMMP